MIDRIVIAVTIYMGRSRHQHFGNIQNAYIRLEDCRDHNEMCRYELSNNTEYSGYVTVHFGDLVHTENGWEFEAVGKADDAGDIGAFAEKYS
jgi:stress response protein SCP2